MSDFITQFAADERARKLIEEKTDCNFFVEASAGSGKTTALVNRMVSLVRSGVPVNLICAITFTKAAAKEFRHRFQHRLSALSCDTSIPEEQRLLFERALTDIDLCFTGTIDAFCNMVLSEHPLEARIPPDASVLTDKTKTEKILRREYLRVGRGEYGPALKEKYLRFCAVNSNAEDVFMNNISGFMDTRNAQLVFSPPQPMNQNSPSKQKLLLEMIDELLDRRDELVYTNNRTTPDAHRKRMQVFENLQIRKAELDCDWMEHLPDVVYILNNTLRKIELTKDLDSRFIDKYEYYLLPVLTKKNALSRYMIDPFCAGSPGEILSEYQHSVSLDFLSSFAQAVSEELRAAGELSFFDYLLYLRDTLREDAATGGKLIRHIYSRHSYYLIDEFQDTNPIQTEVFFYLTAQQPDPDWRKCIPRPGSLFIVGDPKQSIYRFRNADVTAFLRVKEMFEDKRVGQVLYLFRNFRSTPALCRWFNHHFTRMMPAQTESQSRFDPIPLDDSAPSLDEAFGSVYHYVMGTKDKDEEHTAVAIERLVKSRKYTVRGKDGKPKPVSYGDIMVITPGKASLNEYLSCLRSRGIPVFIEGTTVFSSCAILCAVSVVLDAVSSPADKGRIYSALRSDVFGIGQEELSRWITQGNRLTLTHDIDSDAAGCEGLRDALEQLRMLYRLSLNLTVSSAMEIIIDRLELFRRFDSDNLEYLYFALELLRQAEISGEIASLMQGAQFLRDLVYNSEPERCITLMKQTNRVHIANLHKVKGLEAPVVILAKPSTKVFSVDHRVDCTQDPPVCYRFSLKGSVHSSTHEFADEKELEEACAAEERIRQLYVAATRARDILVIAESRDAKGNLASSNPWNEFLSEGLSELAPMPVNPNPEAAAKPTLEADVLSGLAQQLCVFGQRESEADTYSIIRPSQTKVRSTADDEELPVEPADEEITEHIRSDFSRRNAAVLGTMVHRMLEALVSSGGKTDTDALARIMREEYPCDDDTGEKLEAIVAEVGRKMLGGGYPQSNGIPDDLLAELAAAEKVMTEVPFCLKNKEDGKPSLVHGIMDLVYLKDGQWHIVDYKTSENARDLDKHYESQLSAYRKAFLQLTGSDADARVYHIDA